MRYGFSSPGYEGSHGGRSLYDACQRSFALLGCSPHISDSRPPAPCPYARRPFVEFLAVPPAGAPPRPGDARRGDQPPGAAHTPKDNTRLVRRVDLPTENKKDHHKKKEEQNARRRQRQRLPADLDDPD